MTSVPPPPGRLGKLLCGCHGIVRTGHQHGDLVAARLRQKPLQLPHSAVNSAAGAQVHFTDHDEDGNFERHGKAQVLAGGSGCKEKTRLSQCGGTHGEW